MPILKRKTKKAFAIVKLWPDIKAAEDECISRIMKAATSLGVKTYEVNANGYLSNKLDKRLSNEDVDFFLHLHFDTPKNYDGMSIVTLWNPPEFYLQWGYERTVRNLFSHDAFLSCGSERADAVVGRLLKNSYQHEPPISKLYHSLDSIHYPPAISKELKLFYIGINWEALNGESRHSGLLKRIDNPNKLEIYGPKVFQGVRVWKGYKSYVGELPFDGVSVTKALSRCGICLALSSAGHRRAGIMSNRLFEAISAGALVICDKNEFCLNIFGENLLYVDIDESEERLAEQIQSHVKWANKNRNTVKKMVSNTQAIFKSEFSLTVGISALYEKLTDAKFYFNALNASTPITLIVIVDSVNKDEISKIFQDISKQEVDDLKCIIICRNEIKKTIGKIATKIFSTKIEYVIELDDRIKLSGDQYGFSLGGLLLEHIKPLEMDVNFMIVRVGSRARLYSNHLRTLSYLIERDAEKSVAVSPVASFDGKNCEVIDDINPYSHICNLTERFLFKRSWIDPKNLEIGRHLTHFFIVSLIGENLIKHSLTSTIEFNAATKNLFVSDHISLSLEFIQYRDMMDGNLELIQKTSQPLWPNIKTFTSNAHDTSIGAELRFGGLLGRLMSGKWWRLQALALKRQGFLDRLNALRKLIYASNKDMTK